MDLGRPSWARRDLEHEPRLEPVAPVTDVDMSAPPGALEIPHMPVSFTVNGEPVTVDAPPEMPLLWVLRDLLDLKGTKFGCGIGQCSACMVHVDGIASRSCQRRLETVDGRGITTIEGLSADGSHPIQEAWRELDVPQCGYCQAGQLMAAASLLETTRRPTDADIDRAMNRNLCRCGTYIRIRAGIHRAAEILAEQEGSRSGADDGAPGGGG